MELSDILFKEYYVELERLKFRYEKRIVNEINKFAYADSYLRDATDDLPALHLVISRDLDSNDLSKRIVAIHSNGSQKEYFDYTKKPLSQKNEVIQYIMFILETVKKDYAS
jgi:hypothetical protein